MRSLTLYSLLALTFTTPQVMGESGIILKGKDLDEAALIQALTPEEGSIRTRSLRVERDSPTMRPIKPAAASLLITFPSNSATLMPQARNQLDMVGRALNHDKLAAFSFAIEGHADPRGLADLNQRLSEARAESVRRYLIQIHNLSAERLTAVGKGDKEPIDRKNPAAAENRRVTIVNQASEY